MIIGAETLSRISDPHDRDSMLYSDGAGATIIEARESERPVGVISHAARSDTFEHVYMLQMKESYNPVNNELFLHKHHQANHLKRLHLGFSHNQPLLFFHG